MQLNVKTILNLKEKNPHFVYRDVRLTETKGQRIEVKVEPRRGSKGICSGCGEKCASYDRLPQREFIHVPLWGIAVIFLYCMRRLACPICGITAEVVPWSTGKSALTRALAQFRIRPDPPGQVLNWVCRDNLSYLRYGPSLAPSKIANAATAPLYQPQTWWTSGRQVYHSDLKGWI